MSVTVFGQVHTDSGFTTEETGQLPFPAEAFIWKPLPETFIQKEGQNTAASSSSSHRSTPHVANARQQPNFGQSPQLNGGSTAKKERANLSVDTSPPGANTTTAWLRSTNATNDRPKEPAGYGDFPAPEVRGGIAPHRQSEPRRKLSPHDQGRRAGTGSSPKAEDVRYGDAFETRNRGRSWGGG